MASSKSFRPTARKIDAPVPLPAAWARPALLLCFLLSGGAGLVYEVVWSKYLSLSIGSGGVAQVVVLAAFMGGLAAGSRWGGIRADRLDKPLRAYAVIELAVGIYALLFEWIFEASRGFFLWSAGLGDWGPAVLTLLKLATSALTLVVPTTLLGATFPLLARGMIRSRADIGGNISRLYFLNSLGAAAGCALAGFILLPKFGLQFSMIIAGGLSLAAGFASWIVSERVVPAPSTRPNATAAQEVGAATTAFWILGMAAALSGWVAMTYEVAWIRMLTLVLGSSTYAFSLMLATFIFGLSAGALAAGRLRGQNRAAAVFGWSSLAVGWLVLLALPAYVRLPYVFNQLACSLVREPEVFPLYHLAQLAICAAVMLPPTFFQGMTLPAATRAMTNALPDAGRRIGWVYAVNTAGTLLGAIWAGFWALRHLGVKGTLEVAVGVNLLVGVAALLVSAQGRASFFGKGTARHGFAAPLPTAAAISVAVFIFYLAAAGPWDQEVFAAGAYRIRTRAPSYARFLEEARTRKTLYYRDGPEATVAVQDIVRPLLQRVLVINGKVDASSVADLTTQKNLAHLPLLLHPNAKRVLIIGLGCGGTAASALKHPVERVDIVEISREVIEAKEFFAPVNGRFWEDPRVRIHHEDAKTFLQLQREPYDVIISEPSNPWIAGIAGLFSEEFYETCRSRLAPGGVLCQWIQAYELEDATFLMMLETVRRTFPYHSVWNPGGSDTIVLASTEPQRPDFESLDRALARPAVRSDLAMIGIRNLFGLLTLQTINRFEKNDGTRWAGEANSDFFPHLEYAAPRGFFLGRVCSAARWLDQRSQSPPNARLWSTQYAEWAKPSSREFADAYLVASQRSLDPRWPLAFARAWVSKWPNDPLAREALAQQTQVIPPPAAESLPGVDETSRALLARFGQYRLERSCLAAPGAEKLAGDFAARLKSGEPAPEIRAAHAELLFDLGRYAEAAEAARAAARRWQSLGETSSAVNCAVQAARGALAAGNPVSAAETYHEFLQPFASDPRVWLIAEKIEAARRDLNSSSLVSSE
ncbi:MAG: fused MFS/spermidine synthase [Verrucomicrobiae bacterium]|nr:fused MFS/spermidine synthase [Verrucomicrobiae bacterium]